MQSVSFGNLYLLTHKTLQHLTEPTLHAELGGSAGEEEVQFCSLLNKLDLLLVKQNLWLQLFTLQTCTPKLTSQYQHRDALELFWPDMHLSYNCVHLGGKKQKTKTQDKTGRVGKKNTDSVI